MQKKEVTVREKFDEIEKADNKGEDIDYENIVDVDADG